MKYLKTFEQNKLDLSYKNLTSLPELPSSLKRLTCSSNKLTELPSSLKRL